MKFGEKLQTKLREEEWKDEYLKYDEMKKMIKETADSDLLSPEDARTTSLSVAVPASSSGNSPTHDDFLSLLHSEMKRIETFTGKLVEGVRAVLLRVEEQLGRADLSEEELQAIRTEVSQTSRRFLKLEKFVNVNFTGFDKILKKHDRHIPLRACKSYYLTQLHRQSWIRGDFSDVIVKLSKIHSMLRNDEKVEQQDSAKQDFVRSTTKYWVRTEDVSRVKCAVLEHLPVFMQKGMVHTDAQLVNSVYLDNDRCELYHGRLDKTPGAIAVRFRWYGTAVPETVFVERKTHRDSWTGDLSVKERFIINEKDTMSLMKQPFPKEKYRSKLVGGGKLSEADMESWDTLVEEVTEAIEAKQLVPTMRTQYMRTAFQVPFDARVRVSLDTNLTMIVEGGDGNRWFRDPEQSVPSNEITRFPHAVLEVKLQLDSPEDAAPAWVAELIESGMLVEVHKFSKFIHGCSVLRHDEVQSVPYWIDDESLHNSIVRSQGAVVAGAGKRPPTEYQNIMPIKLLPTSPVPLGNSEMDRLLPPTQSYGSVPGSTRPSSRAGSGQSSTPGVWMGTDEAESEGLLCCLPRKRRRVEEEDSAGSRGSGGWARGGAESVAESGWSLGVSSCLPCLGSKDVTAPVKRRSLPMKVEPKIYFANERTFLTWINMSMMLGTLAMAILSFSDDDELAAVYGVVLLPVAVAFMVYALRLFKWRGAQIRDRASHFDDRVGPTVLCLMLMASLVVDFVFHLNRINAAH